MDTSKGDEAAGRSSSKAAGEHRRRRPREGAVRTALALANEQWQPPEPPIGRVVGGELDEVKIAHVARVAAKPHAAEHSESARAEGLAGMPVCETARVQAVVAVAVVG